MKLTRILTIIFKNKIFEKDIPLLRGAIVHTFENEEAPVLFHNHKDDKLRYSYPLIQYKRINGCAAIVCVNEGADAIGKLFSSCNFTSCRLGNREIRLEIGSIIGDKVAVTVADKFNSYKLQSWLPLNQENYQQYKSLEALTDKIVLLEKILIGNILSFNKGVGLYIEGKVKCQITEYHEPEVILYKGVKLMSFDLEFRSNIQLPNYIGLGKNASINYGVVTNL